MSKIIEHKGVIISINNQNVKVLIEQTSACSGCHAKGACSAFDKQEKIIDATISNEVYFNVGERVLLEGQQNFGIKAVMLAFIIPFILILITLIISLSSTNNEAISSIIGLSILIPYYFIIFLLRNKLQREFKFFVKKFVQTEYTNIKKLTK